MEFSCEAVGSPKPEYKWVDWQGIDATERKGMDHFNKKKCIFMVTYHRMEAK